MGWVGGGCNPIFAGAAANFGAILGALGSVLTLFPSLVQGAAPVSSSAFLLAWLALDMAACSAVSGRAEKGSYSGLSGGTVPGEARGGACASAMAAQAVASSSAVCCSGIP